MKNKRIIECIPNFSEGRDEGIITQIADAIRSVAGVSVLNIDMGRAANRTVVTFAGEPEAAMEAAFRSVRRAVSLIDMRGHKGEHPRIGAVDVFPVVPVEGITLAETAALVEKLAERVGRETGTPVYLYENSAKGDHRRLLASCRAGEYEGLSEKMKRPEWRPDFGTMEFNDKVAASGATVMGARPFLVAINFNLASDDVEKAWYIARKIRERGKTEYSIKGVRAIGWYIEEYGIAQVSMNITDTEATSLKEVWERLETLAAQVDARITGTELIGLIPRKELIKAAREWGVAGSRERKMNYTLEKMNFGDLKPFDKDKKILENLLEPV